MATHTPGPWEHLPDNNDAIAAVNRRADGSIASFVSLATMNPLWPEMRDQQEANARLMAAAPDLLAEVKRELDRARYDRDNPEKVSSDGGYNYAKVCRGCGYEEFDRHEEDCTVIAKVARLEALIRRAEGR